MIQQNQRESFVVLGCADQWTEAQKQLLYGSVLNDKIYDWEILAFKIGTSTSNVQKFWQTIIYPHIKITQRIGGSLKWSQHQDDILRNYVKNRPDKWQEISVFLPSRSPCSIQARWKRIMFKNPDSLSFGSLPIIQQPISQTFNNEVISPYDYRKDLMDKICNEIRVKKLKQKQISQTVDQ